MNERKLQQFLFFCLCVCVSVCVCALTGAEAWLAVVTSLAIYAQTDDPGWHVPAPVPNSNDPATLSHILSLSFSLSLSLSLSARKRKRNRQSSGRKKGDIAASAQQSCRSIHQKMETNFLSVVVSPVDVIVLLLVAVALRLIRRFSSFYSHWLFYAISVLLLLHFLLGFFINFLLSDVGRDTMKWKWRCLHINWRRLLFGMSVCVSVCVGVRESIFVYSCC